MESLASTRGQEPPGMGRPQTRWELPRKYAPVRVIGTGGMGTVLLARDRNLGRLVAVKLLRSDCPDFLERLRGEARTLARLEHRAIVRVHELDHHAGRLYMAMEYVPGGNLALARLEPLALIRCVRGVVDALAHAHAQGVVHRDIKPENVLIDGSGSGVLTDFGLASDSGRIDAEAPQTIVGTPLSMSPEQVRGGRAGPASDVFSLGVTLYQKLAGRWPFRGRTVDDVLDAILHRVPEPLPDVPRRLDGLVLCMLAKDPAQRPASMDDVGRELDSVLRRRSIFTLPRLWLAARTERARGPRIHPTDL